MPTAVRSNPNDGNVLMLGLWTGGPREYRRALSAERREKLSELRNKLKSASTMSAKDACIADIRQVEKEYRVKLRAIKRRQFLST